MNHFQGHLNKTVPILSVCVNQIINCGMSSVLFKFTDIPFTYCDDMASTASGLTKSQ